MAHIHHTSFWLFLLLTIMGLAVAAPALDDPEGDPRALSLQQRYRARYGFPGLSLNDFEIDEPFFNESEPGGTRMYRLKKSWGFGPGQEAKRLISPDEDRYDDEKTYRLRRNKAFRLKKDLGHGAFRLKKNNSFRL